MVNDHCNTQNTVCITDGIVGRHLTYTLEEVESVDLNVDLTAMVLKLGVVAL